MKITHIENIDSKIVTKGKLKGGMYIPIIISETEELNVGDLYYSNTFKLIQQAMALPLAMKDAKKILALPEQLSPKILQDIVEGNLKDGDEVYLECEDITFPNEEGIENCFEGIQLKLIPEGYITLVEKTKIVEDSWDIIFKKFKESTTHITIFELKHYLKKNYNSPTKKEH